VQKRELTIAQRVLRLWPHQSQEKSNQTYENDGIANPSDDRLNALLSPLIHAGKLHAPASVLGWLRAELRHD